MLIVQNGKRTKSNRKKLRTKEIGGPLPLSYRCLPACLPACYARSHSFLPTARASQSTPTFNATEDLEAFCSEPVGYDQENDNQGSIQEAVTMGGFLLHIAMPGMSPFSFCLGSLSLCYLSFSKAILSSQPCTWTWLPWPIMLIALLQHMAPL